MHPSTTTMLLALAACCSGLAGAQEAWDGEPALRLPGESGVQPWTLTPSDTLRGWARDLSLRWSERPRTPAASYRLQASAGQVLRVERSRSALALHWRPWAAGAWTLGASVGLYRALPGTTRPGFAAMPVASYERPDYRLNLGLVRPRDDRPSVLVLGLVLPLR